MSNTILNKTHHFWLFILCITFYSCSNNKKIATYNNGEQLKIVGQVNDTSSLNTFLKAYKIGVDTMMREIIGYSKQPLTKAQPECTLGNLFTDAVLAYAQSTNKFVQAAVLNQGGIRVNYIAPGEITIGHVYEIMPFDNLLTIVELSGKDITTLCNHMAARKGWPVSGLSFIIKNNKADDIKINGEAIEDAILYSIAMNDYMANGGDQLDFLRNKKKRTSSILLRDVLIDYVKSYTQKGDSLNVQLQNRISYAE